MDLTYERTDNFDGESLKAMELARNTFLPNGFEIVQNEESYLEVKNDLTGLLLKKRSLNPIEVISQASISSKDGKITIRAELGGIKKLISFYVKFMIGMLIIFFIAAGYVLTRNVDIPIGMLLTILIVIVSPFVFTIFTAATWFKVKSIKTLDILMNNISSLSKSHEIVRYTEQNVTINVIVIILSLISMVGFFVFLFTWIPKMNQISIYEELDNQTIEFISEQYKNTIAQANETNLYATCQIYYVNSRFVNCYGGMGYFLNRTGITITGSTRLNFTSNLNQRLYDESLKELKTEFIQDQARPDIYHVYFTPNEPIEVGEKYYYLWSNNKSQQLAPDLNTKASLSMRNHPGSMLIETFFLVLPKSLKPLPDNPPTSSKELENYNVYWWTKQVMPEEFHTENVVLTK